MKFALLTAAVLLGPAVAGCLSSSTPESDGAGAAATPAEEAAVTEGAGATIPSALVVEAPILPVGRTYTFRTSGVYDTGTDQTAVVAAADADGYLLAGATEADVIEEASWGVPWMGPIDAELRSLDTAGTPSTHPMFDFPLEDGKQWSWGDGTAVAREADVPTPGGGTEPGFVIEADSGGWQGEWNYAPSVGFFTSYRAGTPDVAYVQAELVSIGTASTWVWFEPGPSFNSCGGPVDAVPVDMPGELDAVVISAGSSGGGSARVAPPPPDTDVYAYEGGETELWEYALRPAHSGRWTLTATRDPQATEGSYACVFLFTLNWTGPV